MATTWSTNWKKLRKVSDSQAKVVKKAYLESVKQTLDYTDWDRFEHLYHANEDAEALDIIRFQSMDVSDTLLSCAGKCGRIVGNSISEFVGVGYVFGLDNPNMVKYIDKYAAEEVTLVDDGTKQAIREVIRQGPTDGLNVRAQARLVEDMVGLNEPQAVAVTNFRDDLIDQGISESEIERQCSKYADSLLRDRAETIALNETNEAAASGQYYSTYDACDRGVLDPDEYEAFRIITDDDRLCDECLAVEDEGRDLPDGTYDSTGESIAKVHIKCRCSEGIRQR